MCVWCSAMRRTYVDGAEMRRRRTLNDIRGTATYMSHKRRWRWMVVATEAEKKNMRRICGGGGGASAADNDITGWSLKTDNPLWRTSERTGTGTGTDTRGVCPPGPLKVCTQVLVDHKIFTRSVQRFYKRHVECCPVCVPPPTHELGTCIYLE